MEVYVRTFACIELQAKYRTKGSTDTHPAGSPAAHEATKRDQANASDGSAHRYRARDLLATGYTACCDNDKEEGGGDERWGREEGARGGGRVERREAGNWGQGFASSWA